MILKIFKSFAVRATLAKGIKGRKWTIGPLQRSRENGSART